MHCALWLADLGVAQSSMEPSALDRLWVGSTRCRAEQVCGSRSSGPVQSPSETPSLREGNERPLE
jgi:hypothetical protein